MPLLESLCLSSALRTEFHGLCQCQTCEVQFFSWDSSIIMDLRNTGWINSEGPLQSSKELEEQREWSEG